MRCDTCGQESEVVMRVVIAKDYNRSLSRPVFNCPGCFEQKEHTKPYVTHATQKEGPGGRPPSAHAAGGSPASTKR